MNQLLERQGRDFQDEDARYAYADAVVNALVSAQIKALRDDRGLSQEKLAELIGTKQSGISRLERVDYSAWKIETLRKLARAFGVRLRIGFEEFGTLIDDISGFSEANILPRKFEDDPAFKKPFVESSLAVNAVAAEVPSAPHYECVGDYELRCGLATLSDQIPPSAVAASGNSSTSLATPSAGRMTRKPAISELQIPGGNSSHPMTTAGY